MEGKMTEVSYSSRKRINIKNNFKGELAVEITCELTDVDNLTAVEVAKDLFDKVRAVVYK